MLDKLNYIALEYNTKKVEKEINAVIEDSKDELNVLNDALVDEKNVLENVSSETLSKYLKHQVFEGGTVKSYSEIRNINGINIILLSALQRIAETDTNKYNENWKIDADNWQTIKDFLKSQSSFDSKWIRFLQWIVWAYPDGKAWPQTIALLLDKLWDSQANENMVKVNNFYANNDQFKIDKIQTATIWDTTYNYDTSTVEIKQLKDSSSYIIKNKLNSNDTSWWELLQTQDGKILNTWFKIQDWWIKLDTPEESWNEETEVISEDKLDALLDSLIDSPEYDGFSLHKRANGYGYELIYNMDYSVFIPKRLLKSLNDVDKLKSIVKYYKNIVVAERLVKDLRWKTYSIQDIYGDDFKNLDDKTQKKIEFVFHQFSDKKLEIDTSSNYVKSEWDKIIIRLDKKRKDRKSMKDHSHNKELKFSVSEIIDNNSNLDENKLKKQLSRVVSKIIDLETIVVV